MENLLVTGALGYIGSQFIRQLPPAVKQVVLLDNLAAQRYPSLFNLPQLAAYRFYQEDVCTADLDHYFEHVDIVIHLAALADAAGTFNRREELEQINFVGTRRVAEACARNGCKLLFVSTTSVYGTQNDVVEEDCVAEDLQPQTPYAESKLRAEMLLQKLGASGDLRFTICRFGSIFGPSVGIRFDTAINKFTWQACLGQPITVWRSAIDQERPYLDLRDAVRALNFIIQKDLFDSQVYNILTLNTTVRHVLELINRRVPHLNVTLVDSPVMNQLTFKVANNRFRQLGFDFCGSLEEGVSQTIDLFEALIDHGQQSANFAAIGP